MVGSIRDFVCVGVISDEKSFVVRCASDFTSFALSIKDQTGSDGFSHYRIFNCKDGTKGYTIDSADGIPNVQYSSLMEIVTQLHSSNKLKWDKQPKDRPINFQVSGRPFATYTSTLTSERAKTPSGSGHAQLAKVWSHQKVVHLDRNPDVFAVVIDWFRSGHIFIPPTVSAAQVLHECVSYYKLPADAIAQIRALVAHQDVSFSASPAAAVSASSTAITRAPASAASTGPTPEMGGSWISKAATPLSAASTSATSAVSDAAASPALARAASTAAAPPPTQLSRQPSAKPSTAAYKRMDEFSTMQSPSPSASTPDSTLPPLARTSTVAVVAASPASSASPATAAASTLVGSAAADQQRGYASRGSSPSASNSAAAALLAMSTVPIVPGSVDGPLESWPSFRDVSRQQAEALLGDQDMVFVVRKKSDDPKNPDVFVLTFMTDKTDKKNTMKSIIMFRDPVTRAQYRGEPSADSPNPPWYPSVLQFLAASYQPYGADLRPLSSAPAPAPTSALPVAVASAFLAAAASAPVPPSPVSERASSSALGVAVGALPPVTAVPSPYVSTSSLANSAQASQQTANDLVDNGDNRSLVDSSSSDNSYAFPPPQVGVAVGAAPASSSTASLPKVPVKYGGIPQDGMCV